VGKEKVQKVRKMCSGCVRCVFFNILQSSNGNFNEENFEASDIASCNCEYFR